MILSIFMNSYRPYERESPLLQVWDDSEVEPGMSSGMSKVRFFSFSLSLLYIERLFDILDTT